MAALYTPKNARVAADQHYPTTRLEERFKITVLLRKDKFKSSISFDHTH